MLHFIPGALYEVKLGIKWSKINIFPFKKIVKGIMNGLFGKELGN